mgnify:CR=1 FL=1
MLEMDSRSVSSYVRQFRHKLSDGEDLDSAVVAAVKWQLSRVADDRDAIACVTFIREVMAARDEVAADL